MAYDQEIVKKLEQEFIREFNSKPLIVRSPGRVNIIGEHTDYNNGFVLPAAINKAAWVALVPRQDEKIRLYSGAFKEIFETTLNEMKPSKKGWPNYILGVADQLKKRGFKIRGFDLALEGDVPIGSGMSSSAAVECATAMALNHVFNLNIQKLDLALIAQKAEHEFAGVMCGIMDQFASVFGKEDHVIKLDCQSLEYEYIPMKLEGYSLLLLNTNVKHSLASTAYNQRRQECEKGVSMVSEKLPGIKSLRDVNLEMLDKYVASDPLIYKRCRYVVMENQRLLNACEDLKKGDLVALGQKMYQSHEGLSKEYEVSCKELDYLVEAVRNKPGVLGARMMGGGFGGCTINLVKNDRIDGLVKEVSSGYSREMKLDLTPYNVEIGEGTKILDHSKTEKQ